MKDFRGMKRQRSRNRKPSGNQNNPNRAYESNGPEGTKVRGNAQTIYEKYQQLARDANSSGDRVLAENHLQHAEHYFRMIRQMQPTRPVSEFVQRDPFSNGFDDYDDEIDADNAEQDENAVVGAEDAQPSFDEPRYDNRDRNNNRDRDNRNNDRGNDRANDRDRDGNRSNNRDRDNNRDRNNNRDRDNNRPNDRDRNEPRSNAPRDAAPRENAPRDNAPRDNGPRDEPQFDENGNRRETRRERYERRRQQRFAEQEQNLNAPVTSVAPSGDEDSYVAPAFIASTEPLGASRPRDVPKDVPKDVKEEITNDAAALPAFLHKPVPRATAVEEAPADEAPVKPKRAPRKRKTEDASAAEDA